MKSAEAAVVGEGWALQKEGRKEGSESQTTGWRGDFWERCSYLIKRLLSS